MVEKIPYLKELGVTVVELLPVFQYDPDEGNYWGYMPLGFFAPHHGYSADGTGDGAAMEFRAMVKALHEAGIEVILDVVYNHTTEEDENGPTYSFRGIDNSTYYLLEPDMSHYRDDTGTGNVLRSAHPKVRKLITDSMRFWVREMRVDGFRFDLASIFTRRYDGSIDLRQPAVIADISGDQDFADIRLIAEPWDLNSYELGRSFPGQMWSQWNGKFRDDIRSFVKSDNGKVGALMSRLYGSDDLFPDDRDDAYHPYQSVNLITCHDGFCLYDLVSLQLQAQRGQRPEQSGRHRRQPVLELRMGRRRRRARWRHGIAQAADQELLLPALAGQRHADVVCRRRIHEHAGRQQQSLQPGQHDHLAQLGPARVATATCSASSRA